MIDLHTHIHTGDYELNKLLPKPYREIIDSKLYKTLTKPAGLIPLSLVQRASLIASIYFPEQKLFGFSETVQNLLLKQLLNIINANPLEKLIESMDANGIEKSAVQVVEPYINTYDALELKKKNNRIYVFGSVKFCRDDYVEQAEAISKENIDGFKIHPSLQFLSAGSHKMFEVIEVLPNSLPILIDAGPFLGFRVGTDVFELKHLLKEFKDKKFILAHMGKGHYKQTIEISKKYDNAYLDTSIQPARVIKKAINEIGAERLFLGSDFPILGQGMAVKQLEKAAKGREFELISELNAKRLLSK
ncbi:MAG: amidohydrolase family protein [archaeon]